MNTKTYTITINNYQKTITNTNELLGNLDGVNGVKTGFTNNAGRCLVTSVKRGDFEMISVVLGADTKKMRTKDSIKIIEYAYSNYELVNIKEMIEEEFIKWKDINERRIIVEKGIVSYVGTCLEELPYTNLAVKKGLKNNIKINIDNVLVLQTPVEKKQNIGGLSVTLDDNPIISLQILTQQEILKKGILDYLLELTNKIYK